MGISSSIGRVREYFKRHGFAETTRRAGLATRRGLFAHRMVVYYCDLTTLPATPVNVPESVRIERVCRDSELRAEDRKAITSFWNPELAQQNIRERFEKGATLWLIKSEDNLAGYGWSLQARTVEPYYFPLGLHDVHLFDFHVFPQYRGRGMNPLLVTCILGNLAPNCAGRAFIEAAEWNQAQLSSLQKTPFRHLGLARSVTIFGHTFVSWLKKETVEDLQKGAERPDRSLTTVTPHD